MAIGDARQFVSDVRRRPPTPENRKVGGSTPPLATTPKPQVSMSLTCGFVVSGPGPREPVRRQGVGVALHVWASGAKRGRAGRAAPKNRMGSS